MTIEPQGHEAPVRYADNLGSLEVSALLEAYKAGRLTPEDVIATVYDRITARGDDSVWITLIPRDFALAAASALGAFDASRPLYGIPFAVKDNIDVAGILTTAGCPDFAYVANSDATLVERLSAAGALLIGKTNLDQFATGLNGTRSPYGAPTTPFDPLSISGGSSSGSAVAVSAGLVSFAIGTDTAGSGRVPAALTNTVGIKPSRGLVSTTGIVPACRSLDCPSIFALTVADGALALSVIAGYDSSDPWSKKLPVAIDARPVPITHASIAVPLREQLGLDGAYLGAWNAALAALTSAGISISEIDFTPFFDAGELLYSGPWLAERLSGVEEFVTAHPDSLHPVTRGLLESGRAVTGTEVFRGLDRLHGLRQTVAPILAQFDALLTPTVMRTFSTEEMLSDPVVNNSTLGRFTTFGNLLDLAAIALPAGLTDEGMPFGISLLSGRGRDSALSAIAMSIENLMAAQLGATDFVATQHPADDIAAALPAEWVRLVVVGAHLSGMPLNSVLLDAGAILERTTTTSDEYRLYALPNSSPPKPGLIRVADGGRSIEVEVYRLTEAAFGGFVAQVTTPLVIGTVRLADGSTSHGFLCEPAGLIGAIDITDHGGWRAYSASTVNPGSRPTATA